MEGMFREEEIPKNKQFRGIGRETGQLIYQNKVKGIHR